VEGAMQLKFFANATEAEVERANQAWRRYARQTEKSADEAEAAITALSDAKAEPSVELDDKKFKSGKKLIDSLMDFLNVSTAEPTVDVDTKPARSGLSTVNKMMQATENNGPIPRVSLDGVGAAESQLNTLT